MNLYHLLCMDMDGQLRTISENGTFLGKRGCGDNAVLLYQLNNLYIEIHYIKYRMIVKELLYSKSTAILSPYLSQIDIGRLVQQNVRPSS